MFFCNVRREWYGRAAFSLASHLIEVVECQPVWRRQVGPQGHQTAGEAGGAAVIRGCREAQQNRAGTGYLCLPWLPFMKTKTRFQRVCR